MRNSLCFHNTAPTHVEQAKQQPGGPTWAFGQICAGSGGAHGHLTRLEHHGHLTRVGAPSRAVLMNPTLPAVLACCLGAVAKHLQEGQRDSVEVMELLVS